jgi:hypothetical protein
VQRGIRPLEAFRRRLAQREDDDFSAIDPPGVPRELRPLIETLNGYLARLGLTRAPIAWVSLAKASTNGGLRA